MTQINDKRIYYLFALESMDGLMDGFNRFIDRFTTEEEATLYYLNNLEYKENITYQTDKTLLDVVKCFVWNFETGVLNLYFRKELRLYLTFDTISKFEKDNSTEFILQETRTIKKGLDTRYWFYSVNVHGCNIATDALLIGKNQLDDVFDTGFKERLINKAYKNYTPKRYNDMLGIYYYDLETHTTHVYIDKEELQNYINTNHYICVLDFEANCNEKGEKHMNEIIEFPSVLYKWNLMTNEFKEISRYQDYVKPIKNVIITDYCTNLTGITQEQVDKGIPFRESFQGHYDWIKQHVKLVLVDYSTTLVTCGNWDLMTMLPKDCKRYGIIYYPDIYKKFINIKISYQKTLNTPKQYGLANMISIIKMKMEGRHHSGIADCHNTGRIFGYLIKKGYQLNQDDIVHVKIKSQYKHHTYQNTIE
jgi:inhibitor of KinA sporulation pathway (predicted exonuclease)